VQLVGSSIQFEIIIYVFFANKSTSFLCLVWGLPLNSDDFLNARKVQKEMTITEKTRQAIRAGIESVNNSTGYNNSVAVLYLYCLHPFADFQKI
jgi:hypothetical protein